MALTIVEASAVNTVFAYLAQTNAPGRDTPPTFDAVIDAMQTLTNGAHRRLAAGAKPEDVSTLRSFGDHIGNRNLALWCDPESIRQHFMDDDNDLRDWIVDEATDAELVEVGEGVLQSDWLYNAWRDSLRDLAHDAMPAKAGLGA